MRRSTTYKFEQFGLGDTYSAGAERRRFVTLDYNLNRYIGIVGDGVAYGWNVTEAGGLSVKVSYGLGFIGGFLSETPLITPLKKRSQISAGETVIEDLPGWSDPNPDSWEGAFYRIGGSDPSKILVFDHLGPGGERDDMNNMIVQTPSYRAAGELTWEDPFVRATLDAWSTVTVADNADNLLYAVRKSDQVRSQEVEFVCRTDTIKPPRGVLLAKIKARSGSVDIDQSDSPRLEGLSNFIKDSAVAPVANHHHGGSQKWDPARISLSTDIRDALFVSQSENSATYQVTSNKRTGSTQSHTHTFSVDSNGDGSTIAMSGSGAFHYHRISQGVMSGPVSAAEIVDHTHKFNITAEEWHANSLIAVYVNNELVTEGYSADHTTGKIVFDSGIASYKKGVYRCNFPIDPTRSYTFTKECDGPRQFVTAMASDFWNKYRKEMDWYDAAGNPITATLRDPFFFYKQNGSNVEPGLDGFYLAEPSAVNTAPNGAYLGREPDPYPTDLGLTSIYQQEQMMSLRLKKAGDVYTLLPDAGRLMDVTLVSPPTADVVRIEILDESEVTGVIPEENIAYVSADKLVDGILAVARIPFIGHGGRFNEVVAPLLSRSTTNDGVTYYLLPTWTDIVDGHRHKAVVDREGNGSTVSTIVNSKSVATAGDPPVRIAHAHSISNFTLSGKTSAGVNTWQNLPAGESHTHSLDIQYPGDSKSIFGVAEDAAGNIWLGTSSGLMLLPVDFGIQFSIQEKTYKLPAMDRLAAAKRAVELFAIDTGKNVGLVNEISVESSLNGLAAIGDTTTFDAIRHADEEDTAIVVTATAIGDFILDGFCVYPILKKWEVKPWHKVLRTYQVTISANINENSSYGELLAAAREAANGLEDESLTDEDVEEVALTYQSLQGETMWSLAVDANVVVATSATSMLVQNTGSVTWERVVFPIPIRAVHQVSVLADSSILACTDNGGFIIDRLSLVARQLDLGIITDVTGGLQAGVNLLLGTRNGIWTSLDALNWLQVDEGNVSQLVRDPSTGDVFAVIANLEVLKSTDDGNTWSVSGSMPTTSETGFAWSNFGKLYLATTDSVLDSADGGSNWSTVLKKRVRCFNHRVDPADGFFLGCDNQLWSYDGAAFQQEKSFTASYEAIVFVDGSQRQFFVCWNNLSKTFSFQQPPGVSAGVIGAFDFNLWFADRGWAEGSNLRLSIDGRVALDTKNRIDRRGTSMPSVTYSASNGVFDFTVSTTLTASVTNTSTSLQVASTTGFVAGQSVSVFAEEVTAVRIRSVSSHALLLSEAFGGTAAAGAVVKLITPLSGNSIVIADIYDSPLLNAGMLSHEELEDSFALVSAGLKMGMSNDYLSNLNQLVLRIKNPDSPLYNATADEYLRNWRAYLMRFSSDNTSADYIENFFDTVTSNLRSGTIFATNLVRNSCGVNIIVPGYGAFSGLAFAGNAAGLFIAKSDASMKADWFFVPDCPVGGVWGIALANDERILVIGDNGLYSSRDLLVWNKIKSSTVGASGTILEPRWVNFGLPDDSTWWKSWDGMVNLIDSDIPNTIVAGGPNYIAISRDGGKSWTGSSLPFGPNESFSPSFLSPISDGRAVLGVNGIKNGESSPYSALLSTADDGASWPELASITYGIELTPSAVSANSYGNTELTFADLPPVAKRQWDGYSLSAANQQWQILVVGDQTITVKGVLAAEVIVQGQTVCTVQALRFNDACETKDGRLLVCTNNGLLEDRGIWRSNARQIANVLQVNESAVVTAVGVPVEILAVTSRNNTTTIRCSSTQSVGLNELNGQQLIVPNLYGVPGASVSITSPVAGESVTSEGVVIEFAVTGFDLATGLIGFSVDGGDPSYLSTYSTTLTDLEIGSHTIRAFLATTKKQEIIDTSVETTFTYDFATEEPFIRIDSPVEAQAVNSLQVLAEFTVGNFSIPADGAAYYAIDGAAPLPLSGFTNGQTSVTLSTTTGSHTLLAYIQSNGVTISQDVVNFSVNTGSLPSILISSPTNGSIEGGPGVSLVYSISNFVAGVDGQISIKVDGVVTGTSVNNSSTTVGPLSNGAHTIVLTLSNAGGLLTNDDASDSVSLTIDSTLVDRPTLIIASNLNYTTADFLPVEFVTANFTVGTDGGILVQINDGAAVYWTSQQPYQVPDGTAGEIKITGTLATGPSSPLTNSEATVTETLVVTGATRSIDFQTMPNDGAGIAAPPQSPASTSLPTTAQPRAVGALDSGWLASSNTSSDENNTFTVVLSGNLPTETIGKSAYFAGSRMRLQVSFDRPIRSGTYDKGLAYIDLSASNGGTSYTIASQGRRSLVVEALSASSGSSVVRPSQRIFLVPANLNATLFVDYDRSWSDDELRGQWVRLLADDATAGTSDSYIITHNTARTITVENANPIAMGSVNTVALTSIPLLPVRSFNSVKTSVDSGHWHGVSFIGERIEGRVSGSVLNSNRIEVTVTNAPRLSQPLVESYPGLLKGAAVLFYSRQSPGIVFQQTILETQPNKLVVSLSSTSDWNFSGENPGGIDSTFDWSIDAGYYGATNSIQYVDFTSALSLVTTDVSSGDQDVEVASATGFTIGDQVEILDNLPSAFKALIVGIAGNIITMSQQVPKDFLVNNDAQLRVVAQSFANGDHVHLIRNNQPAESRVASHPPLGYPVSHQHGLAHHLPTVSCSAASGDRLTIGGGGKEIWKTDNNTQSWELSADISKLTGESAPATVMSQTAEGFLLVGTGNGLVISESYITPSVPDYAYPPDLAEMPSSSSSSSESSLSLSSLSSLSTSASSYSSSTGSSSSTRNSSSMSSQSTSSMSSQSSVT